MLTSDPIQLASLTKEDKDWIPYQVRNDRLSSFVIPVKTGIQRKENMDSVSQHGMTELNNQPIQLASLTTDNLGFSFPPLKKEEQGGFINNSLSANLPLSLRGTEGSYDSALPDGLPAFVIPAKAGIQNPIPPLPSLL